MGKSRSKREAYDEYAAKAKNIEQKLKKQQITNLGNGIKGDRFVWSKKIEKDLKGGKSVKDYNIEKLQEQDLQRLQELEKVQKRREIQEEKRARQEEELGFVQKMRAMEEALLSDAKEEEFHLKMIGVKARRRIEERRAKPIDLLASPLHLPDLPVYQSQQPHVLINLLSLDILRDTYSEIQEYQQVDNKSLMHSQYWDSIALLAQKQLKKLELQNQLDRAHLRGEDVQKLQELEPSLDKQLEDQIKGLLQGKNFEQLEKLERDMNSAIKDDKYIGDPEYHLAVLTQLKDYKAIAILYQIQDEVRQNYLEQNYRKESKDQLIEVQDAMGWDKDDIQVKNEEPKDVYSDDQFKPPTNLGLNTIKHEQDQQEKPVNDNENHDNDDYQQQLDVATAESDGRYSPLPLDPLQLPKGSSVTNMEEDLLELQKLRIQVQREQGAQFLDATERVKIQKSEFNKQNQEYINMITDPQRAVGTVHPMLRHITEAAPQGDELAFRSGKQGQLSEAEEKLQVQAGRSMGLDEGDMPFTGEIPLESQIYWWHEKYRPRKPKYFNRVHTGYEWNKYNQTHYDSDNPPPKVVQGYKFNIFYPDLINPREAPDYKLEKDIQGRDSSTCILRFTAGPPYNDIAFKIVNKEWEYSHKKGFKCVFERGIMHLYFNFKRQRYRR